MTPSNLSAASLQPQPQPHLPPPSHIQPGNGHLTTRRCLWQQQLQNVKWRQAASGIDSYSFLEVQYIWMAHPFMSTIVYFGFVYLNLSVTSDRPPVLSFFLFYFFLKHASQLSTSLATIPLHCPPMSIFKFSIRAIILGHFACGDCCFLLGRCNLCVFWLSIQSKYRLGTSVCRYKIHTNEWN